MSFEKCYICGHRAMYHEHTFQIDEGDGTFEENSEYGSCGKQGCNCKMYTTKQEATNIHIDASQRTQ